MARARNIKPGFFTNDLLAEVDPLGRLLFAGLWTIADREGRLEDRPRKIKAELLPYDECDCDALLRELEKRVFIIRYEHDGVRYVQITNFVRHQNPHVKEAASVIPEPPKYQANTGTTGSTVLAPDKNGSSPADSLLPITDSPTLIPSPTPARPAHGRGAHYPEDFETFWTQYPNKKGKDRALKVWLRLRPSPELLATILAAIARQRTGRDWIKDDGQYIPHPATWLNDAGWLNEVTTVARQLSGTEKTMATIQRVMAQRNGSVPAEESDVYETTGAVIR